MRISGGKIRVLVVDDSYMVRRVLEQGLSMDPAIEVIGTAEDPFDARDKIAALRPDVMTCDIEMPRMNGIEFVHRLLPQYWLPVIMVSSVDEAVFDALQAGAVEFVAKPAGYGLNEIEPFIAEVAAKIKIAAHAANVSAASLGAARGKAQQPGGMGWPVGWEMQAKADFGGSAGKSLSASASASASASSRTSSSSNANANANASASAGGSCKLIAMGASTGGTEALTTVLRSLPVTTPGIVIVQHIPAVYSRIFAERLHESTQLQVREARSGDYVMPGTVLIAPGGSQMRVKKIGAYYRVDCSSGERVNGHCPSIDVLFESVAQAAGKDAIGILLTGMGTDGAKGLLAMRRKGSRTLGQDEITSVVYGMPKAAFEAGAVERQVHLAGMAEALLALL
ncbi:chemotaxis-specific protein-glutamate methyltransferase CheB [Paenibacillus albus]|uniref:Protein-glutamate methylesterase/protein-glutamine glutaminase n=1 Tax=Paenibacillus albus TaxID=2495582 RepID=A0A3S9A170_9BACL|nr:chemotaxis-specific protein-glutamate methyltransferase CheB [Paenibacillus albus]AZN39478.1 chemotaxis-specific protein-glutamate methyltransferase CheB [Paenibacillus albus]